MKYSYTALVVLLLFFILSASCSEELVKDEDCRRFCELSQKCNQDFNDEIMESCWGFCEQMDSSWDGLANVSFDRRDFVCVKYENCDEFTDCVINGDAANEEADGDGEEAADTEAEDQEAQTE